MCVQMLLALVRYAATAIVVAVGIHSDFVLSLRASSLSHHGLEVAQLEDRQPV